MKIIGSCILLTLCISLTGFARQRDSFAIRGVLPWHNFLSGPSAWNKEDYVRYLDTCANAGINFVGFHNYTGGGERYAMYVEPMIKIAYRSLIPQACFDHSLTTRWGYYPMKVKDFAFGTSVAYKPSAGATAFGADCSVLSRTTDEHYTASQQLMKEVMQLAHERKMQFAMGFEFGVLPPEFFSLNDGAGNFYWPGEANMIPNPAHPTSIALLYAAIDDILETYKGINWIWLWLNEHSFMGVDPVRALSDSAFRKVYDKYENNFTEAANDEKAKFIGVWSLQYMQLAREYLHAKAPKVKLMLGGWGGGNQLPVILKGLNRALPKDIVFSCLNPDLGKTPQPAFLADIAKDRQVIAIPWLEGDHQLWHYQPRVALMRDHVELAATQQLHGVVAIHWRTKETAFNFKTFAAFAGNKNKKASLTDLYRNYLLQSCGETAAKELTALFVDMDTTAYQRGSLSPEYYAYTPQWGRLNDAMRQRTKRLIDKIGAVLKQEKNPAFRKELEWFNSTFTFELLLDETGRCMEPVFDLRAQCIQQGSSAVNTSTLREARALFNKAPVEKLFKTFASKIDSRGELGELSALNQKLWSEYRSLQAFLEKMESNNHADH